MKKQVLLFSFFLVSAILATTAHAQQLPTIEAIQLHSHIEDYFGKWPANTDPDEAVEMDIVAAILSSGTEKMRLFEGCDQKVRIVLSAPIPEGKEVYLNFVFTDSSSTGGINARDAVTIPDRVAIPHDVNYLDIEMPYEIKHIPDDLNGSLIGVGVYIEGPEVANRSAIQPDLEEIKYDYVHIYNRFTYNVVFSPPTTSNEGSLRLNIQGGSPDIVCSLDGGFTWMKPQEEFTDSDLLNKAFEAGVIYIKEPASCHLATIPFVPVIDDPVTPTTLRPVTIPDIANAIINYEPGIHYIVSTSDFVFTIRPTGTNAGLIPLVKTNRTSIPDSEGVKIEDNGDGSYTVTILYIQQAITLSIDFATSNEAIGNGNKVWSHKDQLYIQVSANTTANIYQATGALVKSMVVSAGGTTSVSLPAGFYIVKLDNDKAYKVTLR